MTTSHSAHTVFSIGLDNSRGSNDEDLISSGLNCLAQNTASSKNVVRGAVGGASRDLIDGQFDTVFGPPHKASPLVIDGSTRRIPDKL